ncbi:MAG TPA: VWA domain-containing protein [Bryobacteraceae bacterium]
MRCSRRDLLISALSFAAARRFSFAAAQGQAQQPVAQQAAPEDVGDSAAFSTGVKVVNVLATVRGKNGALIRDLSQDDFTLLENGRAQAIRYFSRETDLPLSLGLMVDTSLSQGKVLDAERGASFRFLDQVLREDKDQFFVMQFDLAVLMRQGFTNSRQKLQDALAFVDLPTRRELMLQRGGGTLLYDAVIAAAETMKAQRNRKAGIVLTDGVDTGSDATLDAAIEAAQRADLMMYSIEFSDEGYYGLFGGGGDGKKVLMRLARETGGSFFEVSKKLTIDQIFDAIQVELRSQYSLGFVSDTPVRVSEFRKLQLLAKQKGLTVESRDRYWAQR